MTELSWDPFDAEIDADPHPVWRRLRDEAPVYRNEQYDFWAVSRYQHVEQVHRDHARFSSARGTVLELMDTDLGGHGSIVFKDPPEHTVLRGLISRAFTPRRIAGLEPVIRQVCAELLDPLRDAPTFDYVQDFAGKLSARVICTFLGATAEEAEEQRHTVDESMHAEPGVGQLNERAINASMRLWGFIDDLADRRQADPQDDLMSVLLQAEVDDGEGGLRRLARQDIIDFGSLLFGAGVETIVRLLGNAGVLLAEHPDQRRFLVDNPDQVPNAVEELLRFEAPSPVQGRITTQEVEVHEVILPKDAKVLMLTGSAGRDDRVYDEPDRFDVQRRFSQHLTFGFGVHFCLGASLARMESRIGIEETLRRWPTWDVDPARTERAYTSTVRGYKHVGMVLGA